MAKTKEITFTCTDIRISPQRYNSTNITVEDPNSEEILNGMNKEDIIDWAQSNLSPEQIFSTSELEKWAESEGYVKGGNNEQ